MKNLIYGKGCPKGKYKYIEAISPLIYDGLMNKLSLRSNLPTQEWQVLYTPMRKLQTKLQSAFFKTGRNAFWCWCRPLWTKNLQHTQRILLPYLICEKTRYMGKRNGPIYLSIPEHFLDRESVHKSGAFWNNHKEDIQKYIAILPI